MAVPYLRRLFESKSGRTILSAALFALLTLLIFRNYFHGGFLVGSDAMGPLADLEMMKVEGSYFSSWRAFTSLGHLNYPSPTLGAIYYLSMEVLGLDPATVWKGLIVLFFWLAGFLMYICASRITGSQVAGLVAGLAYLFNQVFLSQVTEMHHFFIMGYALFPLLFLFLYIMLQGEKRWAAIALPAFALLYGTIGAPHTILITGVFLILFILTYAFLFFGKSKAKMAYVLVVGAITIFLVILPMALMKYSGGGYSSWDVHYTIQEAGIYSSYSIYHSFVMASSENTFVFGSPVGQWTLPGVLWPLGLAVAVIIPLIALTSMKITSRRHLLTSLLIPSLIFIMVANGPNPPEGQAFTLAFQNVPLMDSIRVYSRLHLLTGFAFALMIAVALAHFEELRAETTFPKGTWGKIKRTVFSNRKVLTCLIVFALIFPSSVVLSGEIRSFDLPAVYSEPYQWLKDQEGDFRVLNLPFQRVYYTSNYERYGDYPGTMTLDVGMYSPLMSDKPFAFGVETQDFWSFIGTTLDNREFGYREVPGLLGGTASVRYFVAQVQTDINETQLFSSLNGTSQAIQFENGGSILGNDQWGPRVHPLSKICLASGGRAVIPTINGLGLVDPSTDGIVLLSQLSNETEREEMLSLASILVVSDGDLMELAVEAGLWDGGEVVNLMDFGDAHTTDSQSSWILSSADYLAGYTLQPTANTSGKNSLSVGMNGKSAGNYDLSVRLMYGPDAGTLNLSVDGNQVASIFPYSDHPHAGWIKLSDLHLEGSNHQVTFSNDGSGENSLEKLILAPHSRTTEVLNETEGLLQKYRDKVVYVFSGAQSSRWTPGTYFGWEGEEGGGISNTMMLQSQDFVGKMEIIDDQRTSDGLAGHLGPGTNATSSLLRDLFPGSTYLARFSLAAIDNSTGSCSLEILDEEGNTIASKLVLGSELSDATFQSVPFNFTVPSGTKAMQVRVNSTGSTSILLDQVVVKNESLSNPQLAFDLPFEGNYTLGIAPGSPNSSNQEVTIDGIGYAAVQEGKISKFDLEGVAEGNHTVSFGMGNVYALFVAPSDMEVNATTSSVTFEKQSDVEYKINVSSNGPAWLLLSESYHPLWKAEMDGKELLHVPVNSIVNAYFIPEAGNHTVTAVFHGQDAYGNMLVEMLAFLVLCTTVLVFLGNKRAKRWLRVRWGEWLPRIFRNRSL